MTANWRKVSRPHIKRVIREKGSWSGLISQCKVHPWHLDHGWCLGMTTHELRSAEEVDNMKANFEAVNSDPELGRTASYWERV